MVRIPDAQPLFSFYPQLTSDVVALQADNGLYLTRAIDGTYPIVAAKSSIDLFSTFKLTLLSDPLIPPVTIALQADNGLYLSRINRDGRNPIEAAKSSIDFFSKFVVFATEQAGKWSILASGSLFLSRINRGDTEPIEAAKANVDAFSMFTIVPIFEVE